MISTLECAQACSDSYSWAGAWDTQEELNGISYGVRLSPSGFIIVTFRGSDNPGDWIRDFEAIPIWYPGLGFVHAGFAIGIAGSGSGGPGGVTASA